MKQMVQTQLKTSEWKIQYELKKPGQKNTAAENKSYSVLKLNSAEQAQNKIWDITGSFDH